MEHFGTGTMVAVFKQVGTDASDSEVLKMSVNTSDSWCAQSFSTRVIGACSLAGVNSFKGPPHISCGHTEGCVIKWWYKSNAGRGCVRILKASVETY